MPELFSGSSVLYKDMNTQSFAVANLERDLEYSIPRYDGQPHANGDTAPKKPTEHPIQGDYTIQHHSNMVETTANRLIATTSCLTNKQLSLYCTSYRCPCRVLSVYGELGALLYDPISVAKAGVASARLVQHSDEEGEGYGEGGRPDVDRSDAKLDLHGEQLYREMHRVLRDIGPEVMAEGRTEGPLAFRRDPQ